MLKSLSHKGTATRSTLAAASGVAALVLVNELPPLFTGGGSLAILVVAPALLLLGFLVVRKWNQVPQALLVVTLAILAAGLLVTGFRAILADTPFPSLELWDELANWLILLRFMVPFAIGAFVRCAFESIASAQSS